jgi:phospholipid transport system transporter-binding protein
MSEAAVREAGPGELRLSGVIDYRSGAALRKHGQALINASPVQSLVLDCSEVKKSSSVGVSLLLAYTRDAIAAGKTLQIRALPADMRQIGEVCGLSKILAAT